MNTAILSEIGKRVAVVRERAGVSQAELARRADVSRATIHGLEHGRLKELGYTRLARILFQLGIRFTLDEGEANKRYR